MADKREFTKALSLTMYLGAARADANPEQLAVLRSKVDEFKALIMDGKYAEVKLLVREVMPEGWVPGPEWRLDK